MSKEFLKSLNQSYNVLEKGAYKANVKEWVRIADNRFHFHTGIYYFLGHSTDVNSRYQILHNIYKPVVRHLIIYNEGPLDFELYEYIVNAIINMLLYQNSIYYDRILYDLVESIKYRVNPVKYNMSRSRF